MNKHQRDSAMIKLIPIERDFKRGRDVDAFTNLLRINLMLIDELHSTQQEVAELKRENITPKLRRDQPLHEREIKNDLDLSDFIADCRNLNENGTSIYAFTLLKTLTRHVCFIDNSDRQRELIDFSHVMTISNKFIQGMNAHDKNNTNEEAVRQMSDAYNQLENYIKNAFILIHD